jgi:hypothetical protein
MEREKLEETLVSVGRGRVCPQYAAKATLAVLAIFEKKLANSGRQPRNALDGYRALCIGRTKTVARGHLGISSRRGKFVAQEFPVVRGSHCLKDRLIVKAGGALFSGLSPPFPARLSDPCFTPRDAFTIVVHNQASTSNDDLFGTFTC